jgi:predicted lipoprotein with Yx(FWY)xxD motif
MTRSRSVTLLSSAAAVPLIALAAAGCGSSGTSAGASPTAPKTTSAPPKTTPGQPATSGQPATIGVATTGLGQILVDSQGRTLYLFQKDSGTTSACTGACASAWPPLRANGPPSAGSGAQASLVGTTTRSDGGPQVTYNGHPVYRYIGDQKAGDTNGQGLIAFGGGWFALSSAGNQVTGRTSSSSGSGGGFGY